MCIPVYLFWYSYVEKENLKKQAHLSDKMLNVRENIESKKRKRPLAI